MMVQFAAELNTLRDDEAASAVDLLEDDHLKLM
jgi:hypothetical protein